MTVVASSICISCSDYNIDKLNSEPELVVEYVFNKEGVKNSKIEFRKSGASRYQYTVDGIDMGKTTSAEINKFIKYLVKVSDGEILASAIS